MATKKIIWAGIAGGLAYFLLGWLFYGFLLADFFSSTAGSATGVYRGDDEMLIWALLLGNLLWGFLIAIIWGKWSSVTSLVEGMKKGALLGLLMGGGIDFIMYGTSNLMTLTGAVCDILVMVVMTALAGAVVSWVLGIGAGKE